MSNNLLIELPVGDHPTPVAFPHFPGPLHAVIWRNWELVPVERLARVLGATPGQIEEIARSMGLPEAQPISPEVRRRSYITVIRRNWHLLPYEQLLELLGWTADEMAYTLREDDFLYIKLGSHKPQCPPVRYAPPGTAARKKAAWMRSCMESHFRDAWTKAPFGRYLLNTALVACAVTLGVLVTSLLAGYAFALLDFPARKLLFVLLLSTLMIPFEVTLLPNFLIVKKLKLLLGQRGLQTWWLPEYAALIVPWTASAFSIFLMRQHFAAMPRDFLDAARIDGCGHLAFLRYVGLPVVAPAAVTVAVFAFLGSWNAFTWPLLITDDQRFYVVQIGLRTFLDSEQARYNLMMAAATITILPTLLLYLGAQRFLVQGLTSGGIKE